MKAVVDSDPLERIDFMEHIIHFGITIDDDAIAKQIQKNAEKTITENIQKNVEQCIFSTNYYGENKLNYVAEQLIMDWLDSHKDEIIQIASKVLAEKMIKTKAVKTAIEDVLKDGESK